ncbi:MAG: DNA replication/repair protein RecF [Bacteroidia bacterium]|nr:DNA replication/repair protein RecF [Bacteroidia bacterium]
MILKHLSIINYKNLAQVELELSPKINCFVGNNGMGKTNLLDAVYYLSFCRSYTNPIDSQIINHHADVCMIQGQYETENGNEEIYCGLRRRQKKQFKRNKKEYEKLSDHIGFIPLVMISPADIEIIQGGSEERRKFMDMAVSQFNKEYMQALIRYNNALQQRNALLKMDDNQIDFTLLELWEDRMVEDGERIFEKRKAFVEEFTPIFSEFYRKISLSNESVTFDYVSQLSERDFAGRLRETRRRDIAIGHTTTGIHRDELEMLLDGFPIKKVGSQGQNKTYFVSLKLAQFHYLLKTGKRTPILLLDDIFDRLDANRVEEIVKLVSGNEFGQIFISDTNRESFDKILERLNNSYHIYSVKDGEIAQSA